MFRIFALSLFIPFSDTCDVLLFSFSPYLMYFPLVGTLDDLPEKP